MPKTCELGALCENNWLYTRQMLSMRTSLWKPTFLLLKWNLISTSGFQRIQDSQFPKFLWICCHLQTSNSPYNYARHQSSFCEEIWGNLVERGPNFSSFSCWHMEVQTDKGFGVSQAHNGQEHHCGMDKLYTCILNIRKYQKWPDMEYDF